MFVMLQERPCFLNELPESTWGATFGRLNLAGRESTFGIEPRIPLH